VQAVYLPDYLQTYLRGMISSFTLVIPERSRPMRRAAPKARSIIRFLIKGPRSLMRTITFRPLRILVTRTRVPNGKWRWAAVNPLGLKRSPLAVTLPILYHDAMPVLCGAAWVICVLTARAAAKTTVLIILFTLDGPK